jgi:YD repeat-containing protein
VFDHAKPAAGECAVSSESTTEYRSVGDFVDEASVVGQTLWARRVNTSVFMPSPACLASRTLQNEHVNQFDSQKRLAATTITARELSPSPHTLSVTEVSYESWDAQGRPTSDRAGGGLTSTTSYDDLARTKTIVSPGLTIATRFDADGNLVEGTNILPNTTIKLAMNIRATQRVCQ